MNNKSQLTIGILTVIIALCAWLFPIQQTKIDTNRMLVKEEKRVIQNNTKLSKSNLILSGANLEITIKKGKYYYSGGELSSANSEATIFINENQQLIVYVKGANIDLIIDKSIRENIIINNSGANLKIKEV